MVQSNRYLGFKTFQLAVTFLLIHKVQSRKVTKQESFRVRSPSLEPHKLPVITHDFLKGLASSALTLVCLVFACLDLQTWWFSLRLVQPISKSSSLSLLLFQMGNWYDGPQWENEWIWVVDVDQRIASKKSSQSSRCVHILHHVCVRQSPAVGASSYLHQLLLSIAGALFW